MKATKTKKATTPKVMCAICGVNPATVKNYVEIRDVLHKIPSCGPCTSLKGCCVDFLMRVKQPRKLRLIKKWWNPDTRNTLLRKAYPSVDWGKVRCG